ncbi:MAG: hypothetical protein A2Y15_08295 [Clostridiales bacterium GWF2_36_10]|nr:MAG: hypothetical protein A2Y15_08295 [Clostridiales bacterium GWF2_36_10]HAN21049.1 hypothetical protein [Clostridiales bacterium]
MNKLLRLTLASLLVFITVSTGTLIVKADCGPKPSLGIHLVNPPDELYYLDLLTQDTYQYDNFEEGEREKLNQSMLLKLYSHEKEGWKPAFTEGTGSPIFGCLVGSPFNDKMLHKFWYVGIPDTFRIIIVTESGKVSVSDICTRQALQSNITYDYKIGEVVLPSIFTCYLAQFSITCISTLIIEAIILILFGFNIRGNLKIFLILNVITQIILTATMGSALIKGGDLAAYIIQFPVELIILLTETYFYGRYLKGFTTTRRHFYGVTANIASWILGYFLVPYLFEITTKLS